MKSVLKKQLQTIKDNLDKKREHTNDILKTVTEDKSCAKTKN